MDLYEKLHKLNIDFKEIEHQAVVTVEDSDLIKEQIEKELEGLICKTLFITDKKGKYFLFLINGYKRANLKEIAQKLETKHLSFASEEELKNIINVPRGSVTPFGIINDVNNKVVVIIDDELKNQKLLLHPNRNTATISIKYEDLLKFIEYEGHKYILI